MRGWGGGGAKEVVVGSIHKIVGSMSCGVGVRWEEVRGRCRTSGWVCVRRLWAGKYPWVDVRGEVKGGAAPAGGGGGRRLGAGTHLPVEVTSRTTP